MICREPRDGGAEEMLLDGDALANGKAFFQLGDTRHSPDHRLHRLAARRSRLGILHRAHPRHRQPAPTSPTSFPKPPASVVWTADALGFLLRAARRQSSPRATSFAIASARRRATTRSSSRTTTRSISSSLSETAVRPLRARFRCTITRPSECWLLDLATPTRSRRWSRAREPAVHYDVEHHPRSTATERSSSAPTPTAPRTSRSSSRRWRSRRARTGAISSRTGPASTCSRFMPSAPTG